MFQTLAHCKKRQAISKFLFVTAWFSGAGQSNVNLQRLEVALHKKSNM